MNFSLPPPGTVLYKYFRPALAEMVLTNRKVRFSPLIAFNDPFELSVFSNHDIAEVDFGWALANVIMEVLATNEVLEKSDDPIISLIHYYQQGRIPELSQYDFACEIGVMMGRKKILRAPSAYVRIVHERLAKMMGAFCLSESFDNLLMWAHYAENHEGAVIGIDPHKAQEAFKLMAPVSYMSSYPASSDPFEAANSYLGRWHKVRQDRSLERMFFTKSEHWRYEREWRALKADNNCDINADHKTYDIANQLVELPPECFVSLHVGCRANSSYADDLVAKAKMVNPDIAIYKSAISTNDFALQFQLYDEPWPEGPHEDQILPRYKKLDNQKSQQ